MLARQLRPLHLLTSSRRSFSRFLPPLPRPFIAEVARSASWSKTVEWPSVKQNLSRDGFAIVDDAISPAFSNELLNRIKLIEVKQPTMFSDNKSTMLMSDTELRILVNRHVRELDLVQTQCRKFDFLRRAIDDLRTVFSCEEASLKVQINEGENASFQMHCDSSIHFDFRRITAVLFLNKPPDATEKECGGLRLYPFPFPPRDIHPSPGRLVLFSSPLMVHRFLPAQFRRFSVIVGLYRNSPFQLSEPVSPIPPATTGSQELLWRHLMHWSHREHLVKFFFTNEWTDSVRYGFEPGSARKEVLQQHCKSLDVIHNAFKSYLPILSPLVPLDPKVEEKWPAGLLRSHIEWCDL